MPSRPVSQILAIQAVRPLWDSYLKCFATNYQLYSNIIPNSHSLCMVGSPSCICIRGTFVLHCINGWAIKQGSSAGDPHSLSLESHILPHSCPPSDSNSLHPILILRWYLTLVLSFSSFTLSCTKQQARVCNVVSWSFTSSARSEAEREVERHASLSGYNSSSNFFIFPSAVSCALMASWNAHSHGYATIVARCRPS